VLAGRSVCSAKEEAPRSGHARWRLRASTTRVGDRGRSRQQKTTTNTTLLEKSAWQEEGVRQQSGALPRRMLRRYAKLATSSAVAALAKRMLAGAMSLADSPFNCLARKQ
jgi:hypothetical protein